MGIEKGSIIKIEGYEKVSLEALGGGRAIAQVNHELTKVVENILDVNTDVNKTRSVQLTIKLKPSQDRRNADVEFSATSKLAGDIAGIDHIVFGQDGDGYVSTMQQMDLGAEIQTTRMVPKEGIAE